jgi:UTP--glucose-1-phosphate uridylyltransferase
MFFCPIWAPPPYCHQGEHVKNEDILALPEETRNQLRTFGFNEDKFLGWQRKVASGSLSTQSNYVTGTIVPPEGDAWDDCPSKSPEEKDRARQVGSEAIERGEVGAIILNGGMATRFGGQVKGIVEALPGHSFLDLKIRNIQNAARSCGGHVPVYLMNSFATDADTRAHFEENHNFDLPDDDIRHFTQGISLRMNLDGSIYHDEDGQVSCHGPGHGDVAEFFRTSGCLASFLERGGKHIFISNVDNLAARLDPVIVGAHILSKKRMTAELAPKWEGDQGGAPAIVDGNIWVIEGFRFPQEFDQDSIPVFNTNTFTIEAEAMEVEFALTPCYVEKKVGDHTIVQIETLLGELTRLLPTHYLRVKRTGTASRFFPIKTPGDLEEGREDLEAICPL